jgi:D-methionine transport system substrate-binding protein
MNKKNLLLAFISCLLLLSCSSNKNDPHVIRIAATPIPQQQMLEAIAPMLNKRGYTLKIVVMDDYNLPNRALSDGEVDANFFQHMPFLDTQKKQFHYDICPLAAIHIEPMGAYSSTLSSIDLLNECAKVAIPSDPTNEARALLLLAKNGLITVKESSGYQITLRDIQDNPKKLQFIEVDAATLPRVMADVSLAVIPTNFALQAHLSPQKALVLEEKTSPYVNIIAVRCQDINEPKLIALKEAMTSPQIKQFIDHQYGGSVIEAFTQ